MIRPAGRPLTAALCLALSLTLSLGGLAGSARGQGLGGLQSGDGPLEINADDGIEWRRDSQQYIARGNARAAQGDLEVFADVLTAYYRSGAEGDNEIYQIDLLGNVRIASPGETVYGEVGRYDLDQAVMVLRGNNLKIVTAQDTVTARDSLEYWEELQVAVARGNAVAQRGNERIRADSLTAHLREDAQGRMEMRRIDAVGGVEIATPSEFITGNKAVYYVQRRFATLTGGVKVTRGENQLNGEYAEVDLVTGVSKLMAGPPGSASNQRVRGLLLPQQEPQAEGAQ